MSTVRRRSVAVAQRRNAHRGEAAFGMEGGLWERTLNSIPDLITVLDSDYRIVWVNRPMAEKLGRTPKQCVGQTCYECVHGSSEPPSYCPHALALADGRSHTAEVHDDCLGGYYLVTATPLRDEMGQTIGCVHIARDISEQKKAQEHLRHLLDASDRERHLISCEIHDGLAQQLAGALMQFDSFQSFNGSNSELAAKAFELGVRLLREGNAEARRLIAGLRPPQLQDDGAVTAIKKLVAEYMERNKIKIEFCSNVARLKLAPMLENTVFRIVQECLNNACRHSKSKKVRIELTQRNDQLRIEVRDWGGGFEIDRVGEGHFGLEGIQERAKAFGGRATITSRLRKGTVILVEFPCRLPWLVTERLRTLAFVQWSGTQPSKVHIASTGVKTLCGRPIPRNATEATKPPRDNTTICKVCLKIDQEEKPFR